MTKRRPICVCGPVSYFADDVHTTCGCGAPIVHRPYVSAEAIKVCIGCAANYTALHRMLGRPVRYRLPERAALEAATYLAKPKGSA